MILGTGGPHNMSITWTDWSEFNSTFEIISLYGAYNVVKKLKMNRNIEEH